MSLKQAHSAQKRKNDPLGFLIIQLGAETFFLKKTKDPLAISKNSRRKRLTESNRSSLVTKKALKIMVLESFKVPFGAPFLWSMLSLEYAFWRCRKA